MSTRRSLLTLLALGAVAVLVVVGCKSRPAPAPAPAVVLPLPPPPAGLLAELSIPNPSASYQAVRSFGGPGADGLPGSPELALAAALELPPAAAGALLLDHPLVGAATTDNGVLGLVLACRVRSGQELALALTGASTGRTAAKDAKTGLIELAGSGRPLGVVGDWLVVSNEAAALRVAGPYVARVLGARPGGAPALVIDVPETALTGPLTSFVSERWSESRAVAAAMAEQQRAAAQRPPDFGDPKAMLEMADAGIGTLVEYLKSSKGARFAVTITARGAELTATLEPRAGGLLDAAVRKMTLGPAASVLRFPLESGFALLMRSNPSNPDVFPVQALLGVFAQGSGEQEAKAVLAATQALAAGLDGTWSIGYKATGSKLLRFGVRDAPAIERGMTGLVKTLRLPALRAELTKLFGKVALQESLTSLTGLSAKVHHVVIAPRQTTDAGFELWWTLKGQELLVIAGSDASDLARLSDDAPAGTLGAKPEILAMAERRMPASIAGFAELAQPGGPISVPLMFASGQRDGRARAELEVSAAALGLLLGASGQK